MVERALTSSRERANALIMAGKVSVEGKIAPKAGEKYSDTVRVELKGGELKYVSRGGLKLEKAIGEFGLNLKEKIVADIGASTGGFTDCALQNGASKVYAIDVGYGQLAWKLRTDERVMNIERTNIRYIDVSLINPLAEIVIIDVSFIALGKVLPAALTIASPEALFVTLIKPQFEAGRERVGKKGVVRDPVTHVDVLYTVIRAAGTRGLILSNLTYSPVTGPEGNIEFLALFARSAEHIYSGSIEDLVRSAHAALGGK